MTTTTAGSTTLSAPTSAPSTWAVLRRGLTLAPAITHGLPVTLALALAATLGRLAVPIAVQQVVDRGLRGPDGPRPATAATVALLATVVLLAAGGCAYLTNLRVFRATETGLAQLRVAAFDHVHELTTLTLDQERRATLVARVTNDVDTISNFVQFGGLTLIMSAGQLTLATIAMAWYSWPLAVLVWVWFLPLFLTLPRVQRAVSVAYAAVRLRIADVYAAVSESVLGAATIRIYGVQARTRQRLDGAIDAHATAAARAQVLVAMSFSAGVLASALVVAVVAGAGTWLGAGSGGFTLGRLLAFLFLVQLFTMPVQMGTEVLNELQNAAAGWRRVIELIDTPVSVPAPQQPVPAPSGPFEVRFEGVDFSYPGSATLVLHEVSFTVPAGARAAVVGETGSGKTTIARLLTRQVDPDRGRVLLGGIDRSDLDEAELAGRVVLVPQEGFLFDGTVADNVGYGRTDADRSAAVAATLARLDLTEWVTSLPLGVNTPVGQRGESLSAGERQLVALARACHVEPDLLVLDEATSSVDPGTEATLRRSLGAATAGRTAVTIAHRLSTAEAADLVIVVADGRVVATGPHTELLRDSPEYQHLYQGWVRRAGRIEA